MMANELMERDLYRNPSTQSLPVIDEDDQRAQRCLCASRICEFAEASDSIRLFELLHRDEYEPVAAVRHRTDGCPTIRVYFRKLHETILPGNDNGESDLDRPSRPLPR